MVVTGINHLGLRVEPEDIPHYHHIYSVTNIRDFNMISSQNITKKGFKTFGCKYCYLSPSDRTMGRNKVKVISKINYTYNTEDITIQVNDMNENFYVVTEHDTVTNTKYTELVIKYHLSPFYQYSEPIIAGMYKYVVSRPFIEKIPTFLINQFNYYYANKNQADSPHLHFTVVRTPFPIINTILKETEGVKDIEQGIVKGLLIVHSNISEFSNIIKKVTLCLIYNTPGLYSQNPDVYISSCYTYHNNHHRMLISIAIRDKCTIKINGDYPALRSDPSGYTVNVIPGLYSLNIWNKKGEIPTDTDIFISQVKNSLNGLYLPIIPSKLKILTSHTNIPSNPKEIHNMLSDLITSKLYDAFVYVVFNILIKQNYNYKMQIISYNNYSLIRDTLKPDLDIFNYLLQTLYSIGSPQLDPSYYINIMKMVNAKNDVMMYDIITPITNMDNFSRVTLLKSIQQMASIGGGKELPNKLGIDSWLYIKYQMGKEDIMAETKVHKLGSISRRDEPLLLSVLEYPSSDISQKDINRFISISNTINSITQVTPNFLLTFGHTSCLGTTTPPETRSEIKFCYDKGSISSLQNITYFIREFIPGNSMMDMLDDLKPSDILNISASIMMALYYIRGVKFNILNVNKIKLLPVIDPVSHELRNIILRYECKDVSIPQKASSYKLDCHTKFIPIITHDINVAVGGGENTSDIIGYFISLHDYMTNEQRSKLSDLFKLVVNAYKFMFMETVHKHLGFRDIYLVNYILPKYLDTSKGGSKVDVPLKVSLLTKSAVQKKMGIIKVDDRKYDMTEHCEIASLCLSLDKRGYKPGDYEVINIDPYKPYMIEQSERYKEGYNMLKRNIRADKLKLKAFSNWIEDNKKCTVETYTGTNLKECYKAIDREIRKK